MGILKENHIEDNKATPITYWKYAKFSRLVEGVIRPEAPRDAQSNPIPQKGIVVLLDGYSTKEARDVSGSRFCDKRHEFLIFNWVERIQETRPATNEEKSAAFPKLTEEELAKTPCDVLLSEREIPHNDYDLYMSKINTPDEAATFYEILKSHPVSLEFLKNSTDA